MASMSPSQLAAATAVDDSKPTQSLVCFDQPRASRSQPQGGGSSPLGTQPMRDQGRVYTHMGASLRGRSRTSLLLLATPILKALDVASEDKMEQLADEGARQEHAASGAIAARKAIGARYFLVEALDLLRGHLKETGTGVVLPDPAVAGKDRSGGGRAGPVGSSPTPPAPAPAGALPTPPAPAPAAAPTVAPAATPAAAVAAPAVTPAPAGPAPAVAAATATVAAATAQQIR